MSLSSGLHSSIGVNLNDDKKKSTVFITEMTGLTMPLIFVVLFLQFSDTTGSECSDAAELNNIRYIRMCEDGSVTSDKVVLDTHSAGASGETTCSCNVNATLIFTLYVQRYGIGLNPNTSGCGSEVVVNDTITNGVRVQSFTCNTFPEFLISSPTTITWSGGPAGDSKYCLNITGLLILPNTTFTITCDKPTIPTTEQPSSPPPTSTTTQTTSTPATITTTTTQDDVTKHGPPSDVDMNTKSVTETSSPTEVLVTSTKTSDFHHSVEEEGIICLSVPTFAAIIILMCLILLYATVITLFNVRRYCTSDKQQKEENTTGTTSNITTEGYVNMPLPISSDRTYEGLELSHVDLSTNTYEVLGNSGT